MSQLDLLKRTCVHFAGAGVECRAGLLLEDLWTGPRHLGPCLGKTTTACTQYQRPSAEEIEKLATLFEEGMGIIVGPSHYRVLSAGISQHNGKFVCKVDLTLSEEDLTL